MLVLVGIGADALLSGTLLVESGWGTLRGSEAPPTLSLISPVHPTSVCFQGVLEEERYEKESNNADVPRRELRSCKHISCELARASTFVTNPITAPTVAKIVWYTERRADQVSAQVQIRMSCPGIEVRKLTLRWDVIDQTQAPQQVLGALCTSSCLRGGFVKCMVTVLGAE